MGSISYTLRQPHLYISNICSADSAPFRENPENTQTIGQICRKKQLENRRGHCDARRISFISPLDCRLNIIKYEQIFYSIFVACDEIYIISVFKLIFILPHNIIMSSQRNDICQAVLLLSDKFRNQAAVHDLLLHSAAKHIANAGRLCVLHTWHFKKHQPLAR